MTRQTTKGTGGESGEVVSDAAALARNLFVGMLDKGGKPYVDHCIRVMRRLPACATDDERAAAILHDVIEDTAFDGSCLRNWGYPERTVSLVERLSRPSGVSYMDYIQSIADSGDWGLIAIKLADNADNSDPERIACLPEHERGITKRYAKARAVLEPALAALLPIGG